MINSHLCEMSKKMIISYVSLKKEEKKTQIY